MSKFIKNYLYPLRRFHGWLYENSKPVLFWKELNFPIGSKSILIGTPEHPNIGDSAIVLAEKNFIGRCIPKGVIKEISFTEYPKYYKQNNSLLSSHSLFFGVGGGNMGDQWFHEEKFRRNFIVNQLDSKPVIFPQTIFYTPTEDGQKKQQESIAIYNRPEICIVAREKKSYDIMQSLYPRANILLTPDIVLSSTMEDYGVEPQKRTGILWVMRSDAERSTTDETLAKLYTVAKDIGLPVVKTDMYSDCPVNKQNRLECVRKKMLEFCGAELVITDRLHGMIFAAITGTPCIVFSNYNHKVKGTYEWISYLSYIRYVESVEEANSAIPELLSLKGCHFDNRPLMPYFDKLAEVVKERCQKSV